MIEQWQAWRWKARVFIARGIHARHVLRTASRRVIEYDVLGQVHHELHPKAILSVGIAPYTAHYPALLRPARYETIDADAEETRWCAPDGHKIGNAATIGSLWPPASFDVVICHGVYGWGLDSAADLRSALHGIASVLRPGGFLLFGWNRLAGRDPLAIEDHLDSIFHGFEPAKLGGAGYRDTDEVTRVRLRYFRTPAPSTD
ncbi:MAG: methyltransferase domain-containing protein [Gemmatimonadota bacterium]